MNASMASLEPDPISAIPITAGSGDLWRTPTTMSLWIDGVLEQDGVGFNVGVQTMETFIIGARRGGGTVDQHADFRLGEVILYGEALGDDGALLLSNYLAAKWGI